MKFVDNSSKKLKWYNRNYFWIVTILFVVLNVVIYKTTNWSDTVESLENSEWQVFDGLRPLVIAIFNTYSHNGFMHIFTNMLSISVCGFYIERKIGSINYALLLLALTPITAAAISASWGTSWSGNSGMWFATVGYVIVDYLFSMKKENRNVTNFIVGAVVLFLQWFRIGFYDTIDGKISWVIAPYQLLYNTGHYTGFIIGIIVALIVCLAQVQYKNNKNIVGAQFVDNLTPKQNKFCKGLSIFMAIMIVISFAWIPVYLKLQSNRKSYLTINIHCNNAEYERTYTIQHASDLPNFDGHYGNYAAGYNIVRCWLLDCGKAPDYYMTDNYISNDVRIAQYNHIKVYLYSEYYGGYEEFIFDLAPWDPTYYNPWGFDDVYQEENILIEFLDE